jgi:hypothetical protein
LKNKYIQDMQQWCSSTDSTNHSATHWISSAWKFMKGFALIKSHCRCVKLERSSNSKAGGP